MIKRNPGVGILIASTVLSAGLFVRTWPDRMRIYTHMTSDSYYFMLGLIFVWMLVLIRYLRSQPVPIFFYTEKLASSRLAFLFPGLLAAIIAVSVKATINYSTGEVHGLGVAKSMAFLKTIVVPYFLPNMSPFFEINNYLDIKPYLFPFVLSLFHTALGLRDGNVFLLNFTILASSTGESIRSRTTSPVHVFGGYSQRGLGTR